MGGGLPLANLRRDAMAEVSENLMQASDMLSALASRAKQAEAHATAARTQARAEVEQSADEARAAAQTQADKLRESATATEAHVSASWNDLQERWREHVAKMRQDIDSKKAEFDAKKAEIRAENAEGDALFAIDYAYATVEEAEYAVLDAISARMKAEELAVAD
jgi:hypothetical protein